MLINNEQNYNLNFKSRNIEVKKADNLMRKIHNEFPVYSNTALNRFKTRRKTANSRKIQYTIGELVVSLRNFYDRAISEQSSFFRMVTGMKKGRIGNCYEQACLTNAILKANGYENVKNFSIYAYNNKTKEVIDLDHVVTLINFKYLDKNKIPKVDLCKPNNEAIIVDTWAGFTGFAKDSLSKYRGEIPLHKINNKFKILLKEDYMYPLGRNNYAVLRYNYPELMIKKNKQEKNPYLELLTDVPENIFSDIKKKNCLKKYTTEKPPIYTRAFLWLKHFMMF